jgi:hypothetical protein
VVSHSLFAARSDATQAAAAYGSFMQGRFPVVWLLTATPHTGSMGLDGERAILRGREVSFAFPLALVVGTTLARGPAERFRGLPVLRVSLAGGVVLSIASLGGPGSLAEITELVGRQPAATGA